MQPIFTVTPNGFLLSADTVNYVMEWVQGMLKVTGPDTCYYILETMRGLEQANCILTTFTLLIGNQIRLKSIVKQTLFALFYLTKAIYYDIIYFIVRCLQQQGNSYKAHCLLINFFGAHHESTSVDLLVSWLGAFLCRSQPYPQIRQLL